MIALERSHIKKQNPNVTRFVKGRDKWAGISKSARNRRRGERRKRGGATILFPHTAKSCASTWDDVAFVQVNERSGRGGEHLGRSRDGLIVFAFRRSGRGGGGKNALTAPPPPPPERAFGSGDRFVVAPIRLTPQGK